MNKLMINDGNSLIRIHTKIPNYAGKDKKYLDNQPKKNKNNKLKLPL